ncbi:MAG TPA: LuxR C-terminal-related transcriptional regulator [Blastococcus sp.]|nr:LuxR C-terminal-related transcriptional regulator [Blastococcus sp.]
MAQPWIAPTRVSVGKTVVPALPAGFTPRPALRQRLDGATPTQVVVVSAPAGSGKTLLLADWVRQDEGLRTAWISLDADDNDPRRLWSAVLASLLAVSSPARGLRLQRIAAAAERAEGDDLVEGLADALDDPGPPVRVVLDDVHELTRREVLRDLTRLIRRSPAGLRLVLASRTDPPISVPRLRLEGRLHELRADALRFTLDDTAAMLRAAGLELTAAQVAVLQARTEGWAAGLRLAALALRRTDDVAAFLTNFSGDERSVAEYLTVEILDGMSPDTRDFLRRVSVCSPLRADVAVELSARDDADRLLDVLCHETPLVERTSPGNYRIHPLLRSYLVADLARQRPGTYRQLQEAAARWWLAEDEPVHALRHAERAGDPALIAALVRSSGIALFLAGDLGPLRRALAAVGSDARTADPWLALTAAITHLDARALPAAAVELENARRAWPEIPSAELDALRVSAELLASTQGLPAGSFPHAPDDAERPLPPLEALLHASRGTAEFGNPRGVDVDLARSELQQALDLARFHDLAYLEVQCLYILATVAAVQGELPAMKAMAEQAVAAATRRGKHPSGWSAGPAAMVAYAHLLAGRPAAAAAVADEALGTWDLLPPEAAYMLHAVHGAALADEGKRSSGLTEMRTARTEFGDTPTAPSTLAALAVLEHRVALVSGNGAAAAEVVAWLGPRVGTTGDTLVLKAWAEAAAGRHDAARVIAARVLEAEMPVLLPYTEVEAHLVEAEAALQADDDEVGRAALDAALERAEALGVARPFALAGPYTQRLLAGRLRIHGTGSFAAQVAAARTAVASDVAVPLSEREMAVLALLPSLLSAREIATEFTVSVNTVKSHIRSIYAKLGVSTRREAVLHAQERGLVP